MPTSIAATLPAIARLGLDTAPLIYLVEAHPDYHGLCLPFFQAIAAGQFPAVASAIGLEEVLVHSLRNNDQVRVNAFRGLLLATAGLATVPIDRAVAERAARLRASYNRLRTMDALQIAAALENGCDAFLTNDADLRRVNEIRVLVVSDLEP